MSEPVICVDSVDKVYGGRRALTEVSMRVDRGEVFGLLGHNGAGKTTLLELIVGLRRPTSGAVRVLDHDPIVERAFITDRVGVQPQAAQLLPTLTALETMRLFASFYASAHRPESLLDLLGLASAARVRVGKLSGGQQRRLLIGLAMVGKPEILVLDEPSAGLDPSARRSLWGIIDEQRQRGTTVVLSTHHMEEAAAVCNRLAILVDGRVAAEGGTDDLIREHASVACVSFTVSGDATVAEIEDLNLAGTVTMEHVPNGLRVRVDTVDPDAVLRTLTFNRQVRSSGYAVRHGSLEDLFIDLANGRTGGENSRSASVAE